MPIAGVDESGRGPLAGPVVAAAVVLDDSVRISGLADSKTLSPSRRLVLSGYIRDFSLSWSVGFASESEIDHLNILRATLLAMRRAVLGLTTEPESIIVDGIYRPEVPYPCRAVIGADVCVPEVSAASIIAKVSRDALMEVYDRRFPGYGFGTHKGYPTADHRNALERLGVLSVHRRSFGPVRDRLQSASSRAAEGYRDGD